MSDDPEELIPNWYDHSNVGCSFPKTLELRRKPEGTLDARITVTISEEQIRVNGIISDKNIPIKEESHTFEGPKYIEEALLLRGNMIADYDRNYFER